MEIRSTRQSFTPKASQDQRQAYKASLEKFEEIAPAAYDRYQNRSALVDNLAPIPAAIGVIGGTAAICHTENRCWTKSSAPSTPSLPYPSQ